MVCKVSLFTLSVDSRADDQRYQRDWPVRSELTPGAHNVRNTALVRREEVLLPSF